MCNTTVLASNFYTDVDSALLLPRLLAEQQYPPFSLRRFYTEHQGGITARLAAKLL